jgi:hypothetical protein
MENLSQDDEESIQDLLDHVEVVIACDSCDSQHSVSVAIVRESQRILAEGCTGTSPFECDAAFYATLIEPEAIEALERAWVRFRQSANGAGALGIIFRGSELRVAPADVDARAPSQHLHRHEHQGRH